MTQSTTPCSETRRENKSFPIALHDLAKKKTLQNDAALTAVLSLITTSVFDQLGLHFDQSIIVQQPNMFDAKQSQQNEAKAKSPEENK